MTVPGCSGATTLEFIGVSKRFAAGSRSAEPAVALDEVSFRLRAGEVVGIVGPNGAGKSTIMKVAAGITAPSDGQIRRTRHAVAVIELGAGTHPDLTGRENLDLLLRLAGPRRPPSPALIDRIIEFGGLDKVIGSPTRHYSSGMLARLAFSVAAHCEPELLLLDEVLSVGDLAFQRRCRDRMFELSSEGTTVVLVSHDLDLIAQTCARAILLEHGRLRLDGPTEGVLMQYQGLPARMPGGGALRLRTDEGTLKVGDPLVARFLLPKGPLSELRFDLVTYPPQLGDLGISIVIGSTRAHPAMHGPHVATFPTTDLPTGSYELHLSSETPEGERFTDKFPFKLVGPTGPPVIRLRNEARIDGQLIDSARP